MPQLDDVDELEQTVQNREREALDAGLSSADAFAFAHNDVDVGLLRLCVAGGCPVELLGKIVA